MICHIAMIGPWWYYVKIHHVRVSPTASNGIVGPILSKPKHPKQDSGSADIINI